MVHFFTTSDGYIVYMGEDKHENEDLIKYGLPEDIWFHVDDLSSAHVYLRLQENQKLEDVPEEVIMECAQLVKANSIEGCKKSSVYVIYTRWRNLKKTKDMEVGQIGMHDRSKVKRMLVEKDRDIVKTISKTKKTEFPNLEELQRERADRFRQAQKAVKREEFLNEKAAAKERREQAELRSYSSIMQADNMKANTANHATVDDSAAKDFEDDFM